MTNKQQRTWDKLWAGIDPETKAFCDRMRSEKKITDDYRIASRDWFSGLRDAGLSTSLDADFRDPAMAGHLERTLREACHPGLKKQKRIGELAILKKGLKIYLLAFQYKLRRRPVPPEAIPIPSRWKVTAERCRGKLPRADRVKIEKIEEVLRESAKRQWDGQGAQMVVGPDGRRHKGTIAVRSVPNYTSTINAFLRHAYMKRWKPFTLKALLTPKRVTDFLYYTKKYDGTYPSMDTINLREGCLLDFFYRGRDARPKPVVVISPTLEAAIRRAMAEEQLHRDKWNVRKPSLSNKGDHKWYPTLKEVEDAVRALEERLLRVDELHSAGALNKYRHWLETRNTVLCLCALYGMWRVDTASTGCLRHLRRDAATDSVLDEDGSAVIEKIARAKNSKGTWYPFVPELTLLSNMVRLIEKLLALEGRSMARPLREGEHPVRLSAKNGDKWGADRIPTGELVVVPIFRKKPDRPEGLGHGMIQDILELQLAGLNFGAINPHTLRATGAIYRKYIQEMPEDLVMELGLWEDDRTLNDCYAHLGKQDKRARMARYVPAGAGIVPVKPRGHREKAAAASLATLGKLLETTTNARQATRYLKDLHRNYQEIEQTIAAELNLIWEPPRPNLFLPGEELLIDDALKGAGYGGIKGVIARDIFASDHLRTRAEKRLAGPEVPKALQRLKDQLQRRSEMLALRPGRTRPTASSKPTKRGRAA